MRCAFAALLFGLVTVASTVGDSMDEAVSTAKDADPASTVDDGEISRGAIC